MTSLEISPSSLMSNVDSDKPVSAVDSWSYRQNESSSSPLTDTSASQTDTAEAEEAMSVVSLVTIHMLAYDPSEQSFPITMSRSESFPARRFSWDIGHRPYTKIWSAASPPEDKAHIELTLGGCIANGRIGLVYEAHVSRVTDMASGKEIPPSQLGIPAELCLKFAKPEHCRSLAREAWFYEQLPEKNGYQGVVVPRCFGFFVAPANDCMDASGKPPASIRPWAEREPDEEESPKPRRRAKAAKDDRPPDWLEDDIDTGHYADDACGSKTKSPWNTWRAQPDSPLISLLVMERLGDDFPNCYVDRKNEEHLDLFKVMDDMTKSSVFHDDIRFNNVLRASPESTRICPRHKCKHLWRLVDFDRARKTDRSHFKIDRATIINYYGEALGGSYFRGCFPFEDMYW